MEMPVIQLNNGLKVANFSSPHTFRFTSGEELDRCSKERSSSLMLKVVEVEEPQESWTDIQISFRLNDAVSEALEAAERVAKDEGVNIILVPLPVMSSVKEAGRLADFPSIRTVRMACRETKTIHPDRFCR